MSEGKEPTEIIPTPEPKREGEAWRTIEEFPKYEVSSIGRIRNRGTGRIMRLAPVTKKSGYLGMSFRGVGRTYHRKVHLLVIEAFICKRPPGLVCRHLDGNIQNNRVENLKWGTYADNYNDSVLHGTSNRGEKHPKTRMKPADVLKIVELLPTMPRAEIAKLYGITKHSIFNIVRGRSWQHVTGIKEQKAGSASYELTALRKRAELAEQKLKEAEERIRQLDPYGRGVVEASTEF